MKKSTRVTHPRKIRLPEDNIPLTSPIYQSVKFEFPSLEDLQQVGAKQRDGFFYSRLSNPGVRELECLLADMQDCEDGFVVGSGMAAVAMTLVGLIQQGDHVITFIESYKPIRVFIRDVLSKFGVTNSIISIDDHSRLNDILENENVRLILFESPTNPMNKVADIEKICNLAHKNNALAILDNTVAGLHNHAQYEVDLYIHSLTKYASGHGDVLGGAILGSEQLISEIRSKAGLFGATLDPHAAFLIMRGLKTYFVRYQKQVENAEAVANWLNTQEHVSQLYYPALDGDPYHSLAKKQMQDFGTIVSFDMDGTDEQLHNFIDALHLFKLTFSLGSTESLIMPPGIFNVADLDETELIVSRIAPSSIRLAIGIEDEQDLKEDLRQAFEIAFYSN